ncbi:MAG TPA: hypothetical protein VFB90_04535 [Dehalococcoidia bacterium]|nr:hypothetical protein [Dehalococcoidia bacterium]
MTALLVETTASEPCPIDFQGDTAPLVYFMSFAVAERFGAQHELAEAAAMLKRQVKVNLGPLLRFGNAEPETPGDFEELESLWQDGTPLAQSARETAAALRENAKLREYAEQYPGLAERFDELAQQAAWAAEHDAQVRLTYLL